MTEKVESRYKIYQLEDGFIIEGKERSTQEIRLRNKWTFDIISKSERYPTIRTYGLLEYQTILDVIVTGLLDGYEPEVNEKKDYVIYNDFEKKITYYQPRWDMRGWMNKNVKKHLGGRIGNEIKRLWAMVPEENKYYQRLFWSSTRKFPEVLKNYSHWLLLDNGLKKDIVNYHAFRVLLDLTMDSVYYPYYFDFRDIYDWRSMLSYTGKSYKSLNITLDTLHKQVPGSALLHLKLFNINQPIIKSKWAFAFLSALTYNRYYTENRERSILEWSSRFLKDEPIKAMLNEYYGDIILPKNFGKMTGSLSLILDGVEVSDGRYWDGYEEENKKDILRYNSLISLARDSGKYHRTFAHGISAKLTTIPDHIKLAVPKGKLPDDPNITLLTTVGDMKNESQHMGHCIGTSDYVLSGLNGSAYFFHVKYGNMEASVEITARDKYVRQSRGTLNSSNVATEYAKKSLTRWAKNTDLSPIIDEKQELKPEWLGQATYDDEVPF